VNSFSRRRFLGVAGGGIAAAALAGCSTHAPGGNDSSGGSAGDLSGNKVGAMATFQVGDQFKATQPLDFSIMMLSNPSYPYNAHWEFFTDLQKMTNVSFNPTVVPLSDYNTKVGVMLGAGNAPMIIPKTYHPAEQQYISSGAILPVSDYTDLMPNFTATVQKWSLQPDLDTLRGPDGKFYLLPGLHQNVWVDYSIAVRTDILEKHNLQIPTTWDEVTSVLQALKAAYPNTYPMSDRWSSTPPGPGANALLQTLGNAYGTHAGWSYQHQTWNAAKGEFVYTGATDEYKAMVTLLNSWVSQKLLDPASFTQSDAQAEQKFANSQSFVISANAQEVVNTYQKDLAGVAGATVVKIPVPIGPAGAVNVGSRLENGVMISSAARKSPNFVAMMQFIDWLYYSDAGKLFAKWGVKGETYTGSVDDGTFKLAPDVDWAGLNPSGTKKLNVDYGFSNGVFAYAGSSNLLDSQFPPAEQAFQKVMNQRRVLPLDPPAPFTAQQQQQTTLWATALLDYVNQNTLKFILGQRSLSEWDKYVSELEGLNSTQYIDAVNQAYQTYKKNHG
jgi:putative aldouronate transport system substrate-binding protein